MRENNIKQIRDQFPLLQKSMHGNHLVYLDSASTSQKPARVIDAERSVYEETYANVHRGIYELSEIATEQYLRSHRDIAKLIGALSEEEIIFTRNATESINIVARHVQRELRKGDRILVTSMEHHSNLVPWQQVCRETGAILEFIECTKENILDRKDIDQKISQGVKFVAITHMSNVLGTINPVAYIVERSHSIGARILVDAAQSISRMPIDVREWDADFVAFSGHKMYGPSGTGVLYGKRDYLEHMDPILFGGGMVKLVQRNTATWNDLPWKFEAGTPNIAGGIALGEAARFLMDFGMEKIQKHEQETAQYLFDQLRGISGVTLLSPSTQDERGGVISFMVDGIHSHDLASFLSHEGIAIRAGNHCAQPLLDKIGVSECARASVSITTTKEEIDTLVSAVQKSKKVFGV